MAIGDWRRTLKLHNRLDCAAVLHPPFGIFFFACSRLCHENCGNTSVNLLTGNTRLQRGTNAIVKELHKQSNNHGASRRRHYAKSVSKAPIRRFSVREGKSGNRVSLNTQWSQRLAVAQA